MSEPALLVIGELCVDLIIHLNGELRFGQHEQLAPSTVLTMGSSSAITACGASALGIATHLLSVRGDDTFGRFVHERLTARGVATDLVRVDPSVATGVSTHLTRPDGDRAIVTTMGSIGRVTSDDIPDGVFSDFAHLHVGSYFLQEGLWDDAAQLYAHARAAGLTTSVDGNFDPTEQWDRGILAVLRHVDVFFGNEQEITGITGITDLDAAVESLLSSLPIGAIVICKLGADGAIAARIEGERIVHATANTPYLDAPLIDTVGAGDTLAAGFLTARLRHETIDDALAFAVACATASTRGQGGTSAQPDLNTAQRLTATIAVTRSER